MHIVIDERETLLYDRCVSLIQSEWIKTKIQIRKEVLPIGDILFRSDDEKDIVIIERKSFSDLLASIKDGRYTEQSYRLTHASQIPPHNIIYLLEGVFSQFQSKEKKCIYSSMASLNLFKGFSVFRSGSLNESGELILSIADKIQRELEKGNSLYSFKMIPLLNPIQEPSKPTENQEPSNYCHFVKKVKKENITPENIGEIILCQIPGISSVTAISIMKSFSSFPDFLEKIKENPHCLENMTIEKDGKKRKINKSSIENIKKFFTKE